MEEARERRGLSQDAHGAELAATAEAGPA